MKPSCAALLAAGLALPALASEDNADQYPQSEVYSKPVEFIPHVFTAIGATAPPTYENAGHNNNLSFIVTGDGVVVVNGGASYRLAKALHGQFFHDLFCSRRQDRRFHFARRDRIDAHTKRAEIMGHFPRQRRQGRF